MSGGQKFDQGKLQYDLVPFECLDELVKILTYGVVKYGKPSGWQHVEDMENRYFAALMRHLSAHRQGEKVDQESGHLHLSHALCNVIFLLWKELQPGKATSYPALCNECGCAIGHAHWCRFYRKTTGEL